MNVLRSALAITVVACVSISSSVGRVLSDPAPSTLAPARLTVGANVLVSGANRTIPHMEVVACADPTRPSALLIASMAAPLGHWITFVYRSADAGRSWKQVLETSGPGSYGDPTCAFGADGRAFYGALWASFDSIRIRGLRSMNALVYTSSDGGNTWPREPARQMMIDRPFLAVDRSDRPGRNDVYYSALVVSESLSGADPAKPGVDDANVQTAIAVFVSRDNGKTFSLAASPRHGRNGDWPYGLGNSVVTASGEVVTLFRVLQDRFRQPYSERPDGDMLSVLHTEPGGVRTEPVVPIGTVRGKDFPSLAIDTNRGGPFHDRLYAVAHDAGTIVSYWSDDEGRNWNGPRIVRDASPSEPSDRIVFNPSVAVNRNGVVAVSWAEGTGSKATAHIRSWTYRMAASWDGAETFSEHVIVSSDRHDASRATAVPLLGRIQREGTDRQLGSIRVDPFPDGGGHTFGLTADAAGVFHAAWTDNRTGVSQVWTATVRAEGRAARVR